MSKKIILLAGPTASGKSKLAIQLAKKLKGEIINADSMQMYKEFSILSSRPNKKEMKQAQHHLYGLIITDISMPVMDGYEVSQEIRDFYYFKNAP